MMKSLVVWRIADNGLFQVLNCCYYHHRIPVISPISIMSPSFIHNIMHYNVCIYIIIYIYISLDWGYTMILKECHLDRTQSHNLQGALGQWQPQAESSQPDGCSMVLLQEAWHVSELGVSFWIMLDTRPGYVKIAIENGHRNSGFTH